MSKKSKFLRAFSSLEIIITIAIAGTIASVGIRSFSGTKNISLATNQLAYHITLAQHLALNDNRYYGNIEDAANLKEVNSAISNKDFFSKNNAWLYQIVFHSSDAMGYSIFSDTPRKLSNFTNYDKRPRSGDIIAINSGDYKCLTIYNNTSTDLKCRNNIDTTLLLKEQYGITDISFKGDSYCLRKDESFRLYFDKFGNVYCGAEIEKLQNSATITLHMGTKSKSVIVHKNGYVEIK